MRTKLSDIMDCVALRTLKNGDRFRLCGEKGLYVYTGKATDIDGFVSVLVFYKLETKEFFYCGPTKLIVKS